MGISNLFRRKADSPAERAHPALSLDEYASYFTYDGLAYYLAQAQTLQGNREEIGGDYLGLARGAYETNGIVFACIAARLLLFSEARFIFQRLRNGRPGSLFGTEALRLLETPAPGQTTGELLTRALLDVDLAGNHFSVRRPGRIKRLRPDWVTIVVGISGEDDLDGDHPDSEVLGYLYHPGGRGSGNPPIAYEAREVAHFAPIPDPEASYRGMSWLKPVVTDIQGDKASASHKQRYFEQGATPNMIVGLDVEDPEKFEAWVELFREKYEGRANAYKTMFLGAGADATVVGSNFQEIDFSKTQGKGETRIAAAAGIPPSIVGLSEGLAGSALNAGNYTAARRRLSDGTMRPLWRSVAGAFSSLVDVPTDARLWYDDRDIPFLQEDVKDKAEIQAQEATSIRTLLDAGFKWETVVEAVTSDDWGLLDHTGLFSVQLQPPGTTSPAVPATDAPPEQPKEG